MSIKPNPAPVWRGGVLEAHGRDALAFLHAQLMSDVKALSNGGWQWSGWLSAKGRVIALAALQRVDEQRFRLWLPDHSAAFVSPDCAACFFSFLISFSARRSIVT